MFDYKQVAITLLPGRSAADQAATIHALRSRMEQVAGAPRVALPMPTELAGLVRLRAGGTYRIDDASLALALLAAPSQEGAWAAIIGVPDFGIEAAAEHGLDLERSIVVPDPAELWHEVTAALIDVVSVVWLRPTVTVRQSLAANVSARLRKRGTTLLVQGEWPGCEARLWVSQSQWRGADAGRGRLRTRYATVACQQGSAPVRQVDVWFPSASHPLQAVELEGAAAAVLDQVAIPAQGVG